MMTPEKAQALAKALMPLVNGQGWLLIFVDVDADGKASMPATLSNMTIPDQCSMAAHVALPRALVWRWCGRRYQVGRNTEAPWRCEYCGAGENETRFHNLSFAISARAGLLSGHGRLRTRCTRSLPLSGLRLCNE